MERTLSPKLSVVHLLLSTRETLLYQKWLGDKRDIWGREVDGHNSNKTTSPNVSQEMSFLLLLLKSKLLKSSLCGPFISLPNPISLLCKLE